MKSILSLLIVLVLNSFFIFSQNRPDSCITIETCVYLETSVDDLPVFEQGFNAYTKNILSYNEFCPEGTVAVECIISDTGEVLPLKIVKSLCTNYDIQAITLLKSMPKWVPAKKDGQSVSVLTNLVVSFRIER